MIPLHYVLYVNNKHFIMNEMDIAFIYLSNIISKEKYLRYIDISTYRWKLAFKLKFSLKQLRMYILYVFLYKFL